MWEALGWESRAIEGSLTYESMNGGDYTDFEVDLYDPKVFRIGGKGVVRIDVQPTDTGGGSTHPDSIGKCCLCSTPTLWFNVQLMVPLCSPRCNKILESHYWLTTAPNYARIDSE